MSRLSIRGARVIDPGAGVDAVIDLHVDQGRVAALGDAPPGFVPDGWIEARGLHLVPGLVDLSLRPREPGEEHKGDIRSELRAAVAGGVTTVCVPPDTHPPVDSAAMVELLHRGAVEADAARLAVIGALTAGLGGRELSEMAHLKAAGCVAVSNARLPVADTRVMRHAMEYAANQSLTVVIRPCDPFLAAGGCAHEGPVALRLGLPGIPESAETAALARELELVAQTGARAHFSCLSTARGLDMIDRARADGLPVSADCAAHQLFLTEMDVDGFDAACHVLPPLRSMADRDALRAALAAGRLDALCSDHQPHDPDAKLAPFPATEPGISSVETLLPLTLRLADEGVLPLAEAITRVTAAPADALALPAGRLRPGDPADLCLYDPEAHWRVEPRRLESRGHNTPFAGWELRGAVRYTLVGGRVVYEAGVGAT